MTACEECLWWYWTGSALRPEGWVASINFEYVGMGRRVEEWEIDRYRLVELGQGTREELEELIQKGWEKPVGMLGKKDWEKLKALRAHGFPEFPLLQELPQKGTAEVPETPLPVQAVGEVPEGMRMRVQGDVLILESEDGRKQVVISDKTISLYVEGEKVWEV